MEIIKYLGIAIYVIVCIAIIILAMIQSKQASGASGTIVGGGNSDGGGSFYEKNKGRTREGKMKRWTVVLIIIFALLTIGLGIFLELTK